MTKRGDKDRFICYWLYHLLKSLDLGGYTNDRCTDHPAISWHYEVLQRLKHTEYAICLAIQDESRLEAITKEIYMETAAHFECNWTAVERNIRTAVSRAWSVNPGLLCQMAGYPLESEPTSSQFIEIISSYTIRSQPPQAQLQPLGLP